MRTEDILSASEGGTAEARQGEGSVESETRQGKAGSRRKKPSGNRAMAERRSDLLSTTAAGMHQDARRRRLSPILSRPLLARPPTSITDSAAR